jgi:hypothetical protein
MSSGATQLVSLIVSILVAVVIFVPLNRDGIDRPIVWLGAALFLTGVTGIYPSWVALQHHQSAVFAGLLFHTPMHPWLAIVGYTGCIAFGAFFYFLFAVRSSPLGITSNQTLQPTPSRLVSSLSRD